MTSTPVRQHSDLNFQKVLNYREIPPIGDWEKPTLAIQSVLPKELTMNVGNLSVATKIAEKAIETAAQAKSEAAKDQQALRKLARQQAENTAHKARQSSENAGGGLNLLG